MAKAWDAYRNNFKAIAGIGIAATILVIGLEIAGMGIFTAYVALFANILAYKVIEKNVSWRKTAIQAFWGWISQIIIAIGVVLALIIAAIPAMLAGTAGIAIAIMLFLVVLVALLRFIFVPYFAHKGYGVIDIIKKSWQRGWGPAIVAGIETLLVIFVAMIAAGTILFPVGVDAVHSMKTVLAQAQWTTPSAARAIVYKTAVTTITTPRNLTLELLATAVYGAIIPLAWLIVYFGGKGGENEASVGETAEKMA